MHLNLYSNDFHGKIPDFLETFSALASFDLSSNSFNTSMPDLLCNLSSLVHLQLSRNIFSGLIPANLGLLLRIEDFIGPHFPNWLQTHTNLQRLHLSNSSIRDTLPEWFENILSHIPELELSYNQISGKLPRFYGNSSNQILKMNPDKFEGSLATFPSNVRYLDLSDELFSGHIPQTNGTMNPNLEVVNLSKNRFTRSVSVHLCKVPSIQVLDLSQNKFSGILPECLGNLINRL
ncbi:putative non-specific serine/threonine protein kinase [Helianthus annuus]|nr:putative non-specific serine/threonine protein kinase [Helianthus annuus]